MPFLEHCITLQLIKKNIAFLMLLVKSNIFGTIFNTQNMQETNLYLNNLFTVFKINKHSFSNYIFSIFLFEFRYKPWFFFHNYRVLRKILGNPTSDPPRPRFGSRPEIGSHCTTRYYIQEDRNLNLHGWQDLKRTLVSSLPIISVTYTCLLEVSSRSFQVSDLERQTKFKHRVEL